MALRKLWGGQLHATDAKTEETTGHGMLYADDDNRVLFLTNDQARELVKDREPEETVVVQRRADELELGLHLHKTEDAPLGKIVYIGRGGAGPWTIRYDSAGIIQEVEVRPDDKVWVAIPRSWVA